MAKKKPLSKTQLLELWKTKCKNKKLVRLILEKAPNFTAGIQINMDDVIELSTYRNKHQIIFHEGKIEHKADLTQDEYTAALFKDGFK